VERRRPKCWNTLLARRRPTLVRKIAEVHRHVAARRACAGGTRDLHMVPACQEWNRLAAVDEPEAANSCLARRSLQHHRRSLQLPRMPAPPFHISPKLRGITSAPATADTTEVWLSATPCRSFLATSPFFICLTNEGEICLADGRPRLGRHEIDDARMSVSTWGACETQGTRQRHSLTNDVRHRTSGNGAPPGWAASRAACTVGQAIHRSVSKRNLLPSPRAKVCDVRTHQPSPNETCSEDGPPAPPYRLSTRRTNTACVGLLCSLADHKYSSCM